MHQSIVPLWCRRTINGLLTAVRVCAGLDPFVAPMLTALPRIRRLSPGGAASSVALGGDGPPRKRAKADGGGARAGAEFPVRPAN